MADKYLEISDILLAYGRIAHVSIYHWLLIAVVVDIITGYGKAVINKKLNSSIGLRGLAKHFSVVSLCLLVSPYLWLMGYGVLGKFLISSMIITYVTSVIENCDEMGVPLPSALTQFFDKVKERQEKITIENPEVVEINKCETCTEKVEKKESLDVLKEN